MFQHPTYGGMTGFMNGNGTFFIGSYNFVFLFQSANDTVYGI
jgi:hypothetical protein